MKMGEGEGSQDEIQGSRVLSLPLLFVGGCLSRYRGWRCTGFRLLLAFGARVRSNGPDGGSRDNFRQILVPVSVHTWF